MGPQLVRMSDGSLRFSALAPWFVGVLLELPDLLDSDQPEAVSQRIYPEPSDDPEIKKQWEQYVQPELFALVATAREIVLRDIGSMSAAQDMAPNEADDDAEREGGLALWKLDIPAGHVQGWISALNVARLTLATRYGLADDDMEEPEDDLDEPSGDPDIEARRFAIARIHLLGWIQQMLIEEENPPPSDFSAPWSGGEDEE
jgi:hypothetical protein